MVVHGALLLVQVRGGITIRKLETLIQEDVQVSPGMTFPAAATPDACLCAEVPGG